MNEKQKTKINMQVNAPALHIESDPDFLRGLIKRSGLTQANAAKAIGAGETTMRTWLSRKNPAPYPYSIQLALELLAVNNEIKLEQDNREVY